MGLGESDLRRVCVLCTLLYSLVIRLGLHGDASEDLTFRNCRGGVGRRSRAGGRDWIWWSGKALELIDFDVALQRYIALHV